MILAASTVMRLGLGCAVEIVYNFDGTTLTLSTLEQPAYIRVTRRRSALPHPSSSITGEGLPPTRERREALTRVIPY
jgi:hypothetical protein